MTGATVAFWDVAVVLLASSLGVVLTPNLFHAVLYLAAALVATAAYRLTASHWFILGHAGLAARERIIKTARY